MASKLVIQRQRTTAAIHAAVAAWEHEVTPALAARTAPFLEPGEKIGFQPLQTVLGRMITASLENLVATDKEYLDELTDDAENRRERDRAVAALRRKLIGIRSILRGLFGTERSREIVAIEGRTAARPELLWRQG